MKTKYTWHFNELDSYAKKHIRPRALYLRFQYGCVYVLDTNRVVGHFALMKDVTGWPYARDSYARQRWHKDKQALADIMQFKYNVEVKIE